MKCPRSLLHLVFGIQLGLATLALGAVGCSGATASVTPDATPQSSDPIVTLKPLENTPPGMTGFEAVMPACPPAKAMATSVYVYALTKQDGDNALAHKFPRSCVPTDSGAAAAATSTK